MMHHVQLLPTHKYISIHQESMVFRPDHLRNLFTRLPSYPLTLLLSFSLTTMTLQQARALALSFEEAVEMPHFEKPSFRVNKKIFLTLDEKQKRACVSLHEADQHAFHRMAPDVIFPVANKWGQQGWTLIDLGKSKKSMFLDALTCSYCKVAPKRLSEKYING